MTEAAAPFSKHVASEESADQKKGAAASPAEAVA
jgi:hypothetical protein